MLGISDMIASGSGLYTLRETARYARMHPQTVSRWFKGDNYCKKVFLRDETKLITFLDFVQVLAVRNVRIIHPEISLQKVRDALKRASDEYRIDYPFARKHTTYIFGNELFIKLNGDVPTQVSGKTHGQKLMVPLIERFLKDISFDPDTGLASKYTAYAKGGDQITMNPRIRFGEPLLNRCGYTPLALFEAVRTEGSIDEVARLYGVTPAEVELSVDYFDFLEAA